VTQTQTATLLRREAILDAAERCFGEQGYEMTTVTDIVRRSGASVGSIYHHFGDKRGIAAALYLARLSDYYDGAVSRLEDKSATDAAVRGVVAYHLEWVEANPELARFLFVESEADVRLAANAEVRALNRHFFDRVAKWIGAARARGELRDIAAETMITIVIGPCQVLARSWLTRQSRHRLTAATDELAEAAWRALRP
jgi:AcrR family transcriptional regulator